MHMLLCLSSRRLLFQDSDLRVLNSELGSLRERKEKRMEVGAIYCF